MLVSEMKIVPPALSDREETCALQVYFVLPKGAYATTVLASAMDTVEPENDDIKAESGESPEASAARDGITDV